MIFLLLFVRFFLFVNTENNISYTEIVRNHCSPPFHYYKSWCYYVFPNLTLDWSSAFRLCRAFGSHTHLTFITGDDEMIDPLRDILVNREKHLQIKSIWSNTTWGHSQSRRNVMNRPSKRSCRKIELKSNIQSGLINTLRMPFTNCREKHSVMCRKELPKNLECHRPWSFAYGICYYLDEQKRSVLSISEERNILQCQAWEGEIFNSSKQELEILVPFLSFTLHGIRSNTILPENFGGISYLFDNIIQDRCGFISGDVYLSTALDRLRNFNQTSSNRTNTTQCSTFNSYTFCRKPQKTTCEPPWFIDDGFCLYFSSDSVVDMSSASSRCSQIGGHLLYISNEFELFRLTHTISQLTPFFKSRALAGVWLALSIAATSISDNEEENHLSNSNWQWSMGTKPYLDENWRLSEWRKFFHLTPVPAPLAAGECSILIPDTQIREPIERTSCHYERTVVCRKPFADDERSFHQKINYDRMARHVKNADSNTTTITHRRPSVAINSTLKILRTTFEPLNASIHRLILYTDGSPSDTHLVFSCQSKRIIFETFISSIDSSSVIKFDLPINLMQSEYQILFDYLHSSSNCTQNNKTTNQCLYISCGYTDSWQSALPEMQTRLSALANHPAPNDRCTIKYNNSPSNARICSLLLDQFRVSDEISYPPSFSMTRNDCSDLGGQCVLEPLVTSSILKLFAANDLTCQAGYTCWLQGERCSTDAYCVDRIRFPCPDSSRLSHITCSNSHHDCCSSQVTTTDSSISLPMSLEKRLSSWNILLPVYYFAFHGSSKWDMFFFDSWLRMGSDISDELANEEFLSSCTGIFIESMVLLTHESCLPTRLTTSDKRAIFFSLIDTTGDDVYEKVALRIETFQIYSPFQLVRLALRHDILANKTFIPIVESKLTMVDHCVIVLTANNVQQIRLVTNFEQQFTNNQNKSLFAFVNEPMDDEDEWLFAPIICIVPGKQNNWAIIGISGRQLKHKCSIFNGVQYCQMTLIHSPTSIF